MYTESAPVYRIRSIIKSNMEINKKKYLYNICLYLLGKVYQITYWRKKVMQKHKTYMIKSLHEYLLQDNYSSGCGVLIYIS